MIPFETAVETYQNFPQQFQSIFLSTVKAGQPQASYAPFVMDRDRNFYIYISGLSAHTENLKTSGIASVLFLEDEVQTTQIFARRRLSYSCDAAPVMPESAQWNQIADQFEARFGNIIQLFRGLADFQIFQLQARSGRFVLGFGAAYEVDPSNLGTLLPPKQG
ncbi:pyridoxamine 5'-phosphate oxidase family protein [Romeria aff. gracilis LEGE 07310]|uniref:Pyridoxamine 5'-phosphate oxidase family protein n=1 Tax=Vasconcelosia minhoensis LEGE 07310 TaxID=915328 RepID=A0A8J7DMD5_9CYAN|nr:pyridoxamine 5'-phosphate oxidase family protein [Romeria gracilis]MBE9078546.1 pyridoxamine 5'-phosphate oxidase family protein [Romeria aff. gracilis LEGE 07310]